MDENEFFREATLRICGSLEIEKALHDCFMFIRRFIPADDMRLYLNASEKGLVEYMAIATAEGGRAQDIHIPMSPELRRRMELAARTDQAEVINAQDTTDVLGSLAGPLGLANSSLLNLPLIIDEVQLGAVALRTSEAAHYTQDHARLFSVLRRPWAIALSNSNRFKQLQKLQELLADDNKYLQGELRRLAGQEIIGADFGLKGVMEMVRQVARLVSPVLLLGETGAGKGVIASAIHDLSLRSGGPLIKINCGAIPQTLMDSELFGHEKGAFTGALNTKRGHFERAHGGTIFLDEIGELTPQAQVRLLRVLEDKEVVRVGGNEPIKLDIRIMAATHRDLEAMVRRGDFREDLYFRIKVFPILIPSLRERSSDIPALVQHFILRKSREMGLPGYPSMAQGEVDRLMAYQWPGNVRELENAVERALILSKGSPLRFGDLQGPVEFAPPPERDKRESMFMTFDQANAKHLRRVLASTGGRVEGPHGAARLLDVKPNTLRYRLKKLGIPYGRKANWSSIPDPGDQSLDN
ncbi:MAG: sigma 54-interacting transcriptional regulator [Proteobacteria bacterium]|nr:sigma 54-interacting transcriptional regulator [Pseudomonadota bacterium]MBU1450719.1 sigma 54-interacting transcriptional regulator [Pseudomonadota bacterium]MBU2468658.1 sigma 54-interacting transcriptional regulator [Pseudomonadota bacterium]MBU2516097.1 sigma 54-interacting transcriptional regulator [Pseudomonadota bacterium]